MSINTLSTSFELRVSPSPFQGGFSWKPEKEMVPWGPLYYTPSCLSHQPALLQPQGGSSGPFWIGWEKGAQSWVRKGRWKSAKILLNCGMLHSGIYALWAGGCSKLFFFSLVELLWVSQRLFCTTCDVNIRSPGLIAYSFSLRPWASGCPPFVLRSHSSRLAPCVDSEFGPG